MTARISMEEFADETGRNISVSDLKGRRVAVVGNLDWETDGDKPIWTIAFEGGGYIHNYDPLVPAPSHIVGAELNIIILGAHSGETGAAQTELRFGLNPVILNPLEYAIQDPVITNDKIVFAQRSRANL